MADIFDRIFGLTADPKVAKLFLMDSPLQIIGILTAYAFFVKKWGPNLMKNRKPFELKGVLLIYNSFQVVINAYITYFCAILYSNGYIWKGRCLMADPSQPEKIDDVVFVAHLYCVIKFVDLFDTIFFVLRKRYNQVTFLHFYHHIMTCLATYLFLRYLNNGPTNLIGLANSLVHTVMYAYYLGSSLWPNSKILLQFKKYITLLQLVQFVFLIGITAYPWINGDQCGSLKFTLPFFIAQNIIMIILFTNFYIRAYVLKAKAKI